MNHGPFDWSHTYAWTPSTVDIDFVRARRILQIMNSCSDKGVQRAYAALLSSLFSRHADRFTVQAFREMASSCREKSGSVLLLAIAACPSDQVRETWRRTTSEEGDRFPFPVQIPKDPRWFSRSEDLDVQEGDDLDLCWCLYLGSGRTVFLRKILERMIWQNLPPGSEEDQERRSSVGFAATWSVSAMRKLPHVEEDIEKILSCDESLRRDFEAALEIHHLDSFPSEWVAQA